ncbi:hypothetical protein HO133_007081 [Letharia lupina]|uniref:SET domain-containing protein n=1 Tax=Letharia lupina TaxID=560253 RepID=A0A8H6FI56_9LECA|nr:uncharacterized protein HO133_007081 [Letharia lupina]KAF6228968.1 hypothetical protein HO133_007081 [Letharia lupina]
MEDKSSAAKRKLHRAGAILKMHGLSGTDIKLKDADAVSDARLTGKKRVRTGQRQLPRKLLTSKRQIGGNALALAQETRPMISKAGELEKRKAIAQAETTKAEHHSGQYETTRSSNVKADKNLTPAAGPNIERSTLYLIKASPGKGLGMFAAKDIRKGTRILAEKPFFSLTERPVVSWSDPYAPNDIFEAFDSLPASEKFKFMGLHCPERPDCSLRFSIYEANCFEMGSGTCICLDAARINHSCIPNAHYSWNSSIERETVHAVKDISKGEEITVSYCSAIRTLQERKRELKPYVFTCRCPACQTDTDFGIRSQVRRQQMQDLDHEIADYQNDPPAARAEYGHCDERSAILELVNLINQEGLVYETSLAYHDAAKCALKRGLRKKALKYASKKLDVDLCCVGRDSPFYKETMAFFLRI